MPIPSTPATPAPPKFPIALRFWHWASAGVTMGLLLSILVLRVILDLRGLRPKIQTLGALSEEQARSIARLIGDRIWHWHIYLGVTLAALLGWRLLTELLVPSAQRFRVRLRRAKAAPDHRAPGIHLRHSVLAKYLYLLFYLLLTVMVATGLCLIYADDVAWLHPWEHDIKEVHGAVMYAILAFVVIHVAGVVWGEMHHDRNITSDMINGGEVRD